MAEEYLDKVHAAVELQASTRTVDRLVRDGELTAYQRRSNRRKVYYKAEDIKRLKAFGKAEQQSESEVE